MPLGDYIHHKSKNHFTSERSNVQEYVSSEVETLGREPDKVLIPQIVPYLLRVTVKHVDIVPSPGVWLNDSRELMR